MRNKEVGAEPHSHLLPRFWFLPYDPNPYFSGSFAMRAAAIIFGT
jgi:hypothetical protein